MECGIWTFMQAEGGTLYTKLSPFDILYSKFYILHFLLYSFGRRVRAPTNV